MSTNLSSLIKFYREKKGMSLSQLCKVAENRLSYSTVSRIEKGLTKHPDFETFDYLVEQLNQTDMLEHLLHKALQTQLQWLQRQELVDRIFVQFTDSWENQDKWNLSLLYGMVAAHAKQHGFFHISARALLQLYLTERSLSRALQHLSLPC